MTPSAGPGDRPPRVVRPTGDGEQAPGTGVMGMAVFIASLSVLFASSLVAYAVVRIRAHSWRAPGDPGPPFELWISTLILIGCSVAIQSSLTAIRTGRGEAMIRRLWLSLGFAVAFLSCQSWTWFRFHSADVLHGSSLYGFTFFMLTGLHAAHVVGGLVSLGVVIALAYRGTYSWAYYPGVRNNAIYWHFLGVVWVIMFVLLLVG